MVVFTVISPATAQTWNNFTGLPDTNWNTPGNWVGGVTPVSSASTVLTFISTPPQFIPPALGFQPAGGYTSTKNLGTFVLNQIVFNAHGSPDSGVTLATGSGGLSFQGTDPQFVQNGSGSVFIPGSGFNSVIQIPGTLTFTGSGSGHITIAGRISGSGSLTINRTDPNPLFSGSQVFLNSGAANNNNYSGGTVLQAGNLTVNLTGQSLGTGTVTVLGGSIRLVANAQLSNNFSLVNRLVFSEGSIMNTF